MRKTQIRDAYDKYLWPKCSKMTYYNRIKKWMDIIEALKPVRREERHPKWYTVSKKFDKEMERYYQYKWPRVSRQRFYQRMYRWYSKEEAIRIDFIPHKKKLPRVPKNIRIYPTVPKKRPIQDTDIKIKYQRDEADVIRKEYEKMIEDMEYGWRLCDDPVEAKNISDKIDKLKNEYKTFCLTNY